MDEGPATAAVQSPQKKPKMGLSLRFKAMQILVSAFLIQLIVIALITQNVLLEQLDKHEASVVQMDAISALNEFEERISYLETLSRDWAVSDGTYRFAKGENAGYQESNLNPSALELLDISFILFYNASGGLIAERSFDTASKKEAPPSPDIREYVSKHPGILDLKKENNAMSGVILLPEGPAYFASRPILKSSGEGPPAGTLVMGRQIDNAEIIRISEATGLSVMLYERGDPWLAPSLQAEIFLAEDPGPSVVALGDNSVAGYAIIPDIYGQRMLVLVVEETRLTNKEGLQASRFLIGSILIVVLVFAIVNAFLMEKTLLSRLIRLDREISGIGSTKPLSARVSVEGNDELSILAVSMNDMLARLEKSQKDLQESEEKYSSLLEETSDGVFILQDEVFKFANKATLDLLGCSREDLLGKGMLDFIAPENKKRVLKLYREGLVSEGVPTRYVITALRKDGSRLPVEVTTALIRYKGRVAVLGTARDITERAKADEIKKVYTRRLESEVRDRTKELLAEKKRVEELSSLKDKFIRDAGHELQGPLSIIMGNLRLLKDMAPIGKEKEWYGLIEMLERNAARLGNSVEMMLEFVVLGAAGVKHERVYLRELLKEVYNEYLPVAKAKGLKLELAAEQYVLMGDKELLRGAIGHLVSNAIKFTEKGEVKIKTEPSRDSVAILVSDTGVGISPKNQKRIFERFFKVDPSAPGMGVGLSVAKEIINKHGGEISVRSRPGRGTTLEVVLRRRVKR